jgi:hypothetical protein
MFEAVAPTLAYDMAVLGEDGSLPLERAGGISAPTLVLNGGASFGFMHDTAKMLAKAIPNAAHRTLEGRQTHEAPRRRSQQCWSSS